MAENKTRPTSASVQEHLDQLPDTQRADALSLVELHTRVTGDIPVLWGPTIIGFGSYHYRYPTGREGDAPAAGFAARRNELVVYLVASGPRQETLLAKLGKHRMGKSCLYIRRLSDIDIKVLEQLVLDATTEIKRLYPD
jgi:hypothetical protein